MARRKNDQIFDTLNMIKKIWRKDNTQTFLELVVKIFENKNVNTMTDKEIKAELDSYYQQHYGGIV